MKRSILLLFMYLGVSMGSFSQAADDLSKDQEQIKKVIQVAYVEGLQNEGDQGKIDSGIHPGFRLLGTGQGREIWELPIYTWKERVAKELADGKKPRKSEEAVSVKFLFVDVTGNAAVAKIEFYVGEKLTFVDYISLYKFSEDWMIVSKIFYRFPEKE